MTDDTTSPIRRAAVEAHARALCKSFYGMDWERTSEFRRGICRKMSLAALPAYLAVMGRDVEAQQVKGMADER